MLVHIVTGEKEYVSEVQDQTEEELLSGPIRVEAKKTCKVIRRIVPGDSKHPAIQDFMVFPMDEPNELDLNARAYEKDFVFMGVTGIGVLNPDGPFAKLYRRRMGKIVLEAKRAQ